jgi:hypothetical protein
VKISLCEHCKHGLVREYELNTDDTNHYLNRCLLDMSFLEIVTYCNSYERGNKKKPTYHDPEFHKYEKENE